MEPGLEAAAKKYAGKAQFFTLNTSDAEFKGLAAKMKEIGMPKIEAHPTAHFLKAGTQPRAERGSMGTQEIDMLVERCI